MDRKPLTEPKTETIKTECTYRDSHSRASKRKANSLIASLSKESSTEDEDDQYDFARVSKRKIRFEGRSNTVAHTSQQARSSTHEKMCTIAPQQHFVNDDDNDINSDERNDRFLRPESRIEENSGSLSPELFTYSRRIISPVPKARLSLFKSRQKRGCVISKSSQKKQRTDGNEDVGETSNQKDAMTDAEIRRKLEEDSDKEVTATVTRRDAEIRPLPLSKDMQSKLLEKQSSSNNTKAITKTIYASRDVNSNRQRNKTKRGRLGERQKKEETLSEIESKTINWENQLMSSDNEDESLEINRVSY